MRKLLIIAVMLALVFPATAIAKVAIPNFTNWSTGYGVDTDNIYINAATPNICVVVDLTSADGVLGDADLNGTDVKTGSMEECVNWNEDNKLIIFEVAGTIEINSRLVIDNDGVRISGQSAPPPGITLKNTTVQISGQDIVWEHVRIRTGNIDDWLPASGGATTRSTRDAFNIGTYLSLNPKNIHVDHCSISWGCDENVGISTGYYATDPNINVTFSNCIITEPLDGYDAGLASKNILIGQGDNTALVDNIFGHSIDRNPLIIYGNQTAVVANNTMYNTKDFNLIFQASSGSMEVSVVGNYVLGKTGSSNTGVLNIGTFWQKSTSYTFNESTDTFYFDKNKCVDADAQSDPDDWAEVREATLVYADTNALEIGLKAESKTPWPSGYTEETAATAHANNLTNSGARPMDRDAVDSRIITSINDGTGDSSVKDQADVGGWPEVSTTPIDAAYDWDGITDADSLGLGTHLDDIKFNNFPTSPHAVISGGDYNGYTNVEKWLDELADYWETGKFPDDDGGGNDYVDDPNCIGHYFDQNSVIEDGQSGGYDLNAAAGESEWVNVSSNDSNAYISSASTRYYYCQAITDAGGITLSKIRMYWFNVGDLETPQKTVYIYKNTQVGDTPGGNLDGTPGTLIGSIAGDNDWDASEVDIVISPAVEFAENDLICWSMGEIDSGDYVKARTYTDNEAKLGDLQQFESDGTHFATINEDFKIILYEEAGNPPTYENSIADFDGTNDHVYQAITSLHANTPGRTGKDDFSVVFESIDFDAFPADANELTIVKIANVLDCVVKTTGVKNALEMRIYDGSDWDAVWLHDSDLELNVEYDIVFSYDSTTHTGVIDIGTTSTKLRLGNRIESVNGDSITMNDPNAGNLYIGTSDGSNELFNGAIDGLSIWDDQPSADDFIDILENDYGSPGPTFDTITCTAGVYNSLASTITCTGTVSEEIFIGGTKIPPYFDCTGGIRFSYSSKDGTNIVITSSPIDYGEDTEGLTCDANWTLPSGTTVQDVNEEDATLTLPTIGNALETIIRGIIDDTKTALGASF